MADGRKRSGPPEDSSSSRARQRFAPPNYPDARRRNMMKCIAAVLIVLGTIMTAGATPHAPSTRAPIYEPHRVSWAELREDLHRRKAFWRMSAKNTYFVYTLVPGTRYTSTRYCCVRVFLFKAPPFAASYSYGNFLCAGLGSSPIYSSSIICLQSLTFAVYLV